MEQTAQIIRLPFVIRTNVHEFSSLDDAGFDVASYSKLKFGSNKVAKQFGFEMAEYFFRHHRGVLNGPCVVIPAPSTTVPVAATLLSHHFMNHLNHLLAGEDTSPVEWTMVHRNMTYNNNYADLPKEERKKLLAGDTIYINKDFVQNKFLIFIDDCTITGTHEEKISEFLIKSNLLNDHAFLCYVKYTGQDASIEMRLNHVEIKTAADLVSLSNEGDHVVTTRSLRLFLEQPSDDFDISLRLSSKKFLEDIYYSAIVKGYNVYPAYIGNFQKLFAVI